MENTVFSSISEVDDISTLDQYQVALDAGLSPKEALKAVSAYSRDNARTPVQWDDSPQAGFTTGTPWLNVNPNYRRINVAAQEKDEDSVLSFYKKLIALRKHPDYKDTLVYGRLVPYHREQKHLMAYYRKDEKHTLLVMGNYQNEPLDVTLEKEPGTILLNNCDGLAADGRTLHLEPYQFLVMPV